MIKAFGIDFGTSNSALAICRDDEVEVVDIDTLRNASMKTLKSVLFFDEEGEVYLGQNAVDQYLDYDCMYGRFLQSIKAFLPNKSFKETYVFGKKYTIEDLVSLFLKDVKHKGVTHHRNNFIKFINCDIF